MRVICGVGTIVMFGIIAVMTLSVVFSTQCSSISKAHNETTFSLLELGSDIGFKTYSISNSYTAGSLQITQSNLSRGRAVIERYSLKVSYSVH